MGTVDLDLIKTLLSIIGILVSGAVWVMVLVSRVSIRVRDIERTGEDREKRIVKLEEKTSYEHLEQLITKVSFQVFHSAEFKTTLKNILLHIEKNRAAAEIGVLNEILYRLQKMEDK